MSARVAKKASDEAAVRPLFLRNEEKASERTGPSSFRRPIAAFIIVYHDRRGMDARRVIITSGTSAHFGCSLLRAKADCMLHPNTGPDQFPVRAMVLSTDFRAQPDKNHERFRITSLGFSSSIAEICRCACEVMACLMRSKALRQ